MYALATTLLCVALLTIWPRQPSAQEPGSSGFGEMLRRIVNELGSPLYKLGMAAAIAIAIAACIPQGRHALRTAHHWIREKSGGWWVLVRVAVGVVIACLAVKSRALLTGTFPQLHEWIGEDLLAFMAILFALVQFLDAREGERDLRKIEEALATTVEGITTRGIGAFPDNLDDIVALMREANASIQIIVDFPGYGQYSEPELHAKYLGALQSATAKEKIKIQMVSYDEALTQEESVQELSFAGASLTRSEDMKKLKRYIDANNISPEKAPKTFAELDELLRSRQEANFAVLESPPTNKSVLKRKYLSERAPLFLWLVDKSKAVVAFKNLENNEDAYSIITSDPRLIKNLAAHFDHTFANAGDRFDQTPPYRLSNLSQPLTEGASVKIEGTVIKRSVMVTSIK